MTDDQIKEFHKSIVSLDVSTFHYMSFGKAGHSTGTGFIIDKSFGLVVTCKHLVDCTAATIEITFTNGKIINAKPIYIDPWIDFTILQYDVNLAPSDVSEVRLNHDNHYKHGEKVIAVGNNEGHVNSYKIGEIIKSNDIVKRNASHIQTTLDLSGGSSGSPVYTTDGKVIGMHTSGTDTMSWELNAKYIANALKQLKIGKTPLRKDIGLIVSRYPLEQAIKFFGVDHNLLKQKFDVNFDHLLYSTRDLSSKHQKFINPGDIILSINDIFIGDNIIQAEEIINNAQKEITVLVMRWGKLINLTIPVEDALKSMPSEYLIFGGATFHDITNHLRAVHRLGDVEGVMLSQVYYNAPASCIGYGSRVKEDERVCIIRSVNGIRVKSLSDFINVTKDLKNNDYVIFDLEDVLHGWGPAIESFRLSLEFYSTSLHQLNLSSVKTDHLKAVS